MQFTYFSGKIALSHISISTGVRTTYVGRGSGKSFLPSYRIVVPKGKTHPYKIARYVEKRDQLIREVYSSWASHEKHFAKRNELGL